jgi:hypothetical protein
MATCTAPKRDGSRCTTRIVGDSSYCFAHDPTLAAKRAEANARGGRNKRRTRRLQRLLPETLKPVVVLLLDAIEEVHRGELAPAQASAIAALSSALVRVYSTGQLEERLAALEAQQPPADQVGRRYPWQA